MSSGSTGCVSKRQRDERIVIEFALDGNRSAVQMHYRLNNGKTESCAMSLPQACPIGTVEALNYTGQIFGRYPAPGLAYGNL